MSFQTSITEIQSVVLETGELENQEEPYAYASFDIPNQSNFQRDQRHLMFLMWKCFKI